MPKISFSTLGCRLNQSETASIQNSFEAKGYEVVDFDETSDIVVINTCTVTEGGDADTRKLVNKANRRNPNVRIALVGCQAQVQKEQLAAMPNVRWIVGNGVKMDLVSILQQHPDPSETQVITPTIGREPFIQSTHSMDRQHTRANIKIQDGCDFFCSFCEIPYARGRARSRMFEDILLEAKALVAGKHKELILTGINIGTYGHDNKTMMDVIKALDDFEGLERIRISSIEPTTIATELFDYMTPQHKLCRYLHIPLQSGCDDVLIEMKRKYTRGEFIDFIRMAHSKVAQICIGTDVIVGFPGETDKHFDETADLVREEPIHYVHVFSYSERQMAKSNLRGDAVSSSVISKRSEILRDLSTRKRRMYHESLIGTIQSVLFEEFKSGNWIGVTDNYIKVKVSDQTTRDLQNQILPVKLVRAEDQFMVGVLG